jgi:ankyrin repeat protein
LGLGWSSLFKFRARLRCHELQKKGNKEVVELLLENGAQPDFEDEDRCTPLSHAIEGGNIDGVELLLARGVKVNYQYKPVSKFDRSTRLMADTVLLYYCSL